MEITKETKKALSKNLTAKRKICEIFDVSEQAVNLWIKAKPTHKNLFHIAVVEEVFKGILGIDEPIIR